MDKFWSSAIKATGPVAVIGFVIWLVVEKFFQTEIIALFSSHQRFIVLLVILCALLVILFAAVWGHYSTKPSPSKGNRTANITKSRIDGDLVMGDKINDKEDE